MLKTAQILQGRYQLRQQLANHAGRQTWLARYLNSSPPEPVIVKLLAFSPQMQWDEFKLFEREAAVLKQLNHPQIPNYRDYFSLDKETGAGLYWFALVQEYIPGKSLQQLLDQGYHFSETQVRSIAIQVLKILQYLHGLKPPVLHRDIKPNNLILGQDKRVYLVDFGAVQNSAAVEGVTFTVVGTSGYAPLEQFWGQAVVASDLYALGASLIHLLTGISPADLPQRELRIQFRDKVSINPQFLNWIEALSEPDLGLRFKTASQALKALKKGQLIKDETPQVIKPPVFSKIKIDKSADKLSINIPAKPRLLLQNFWLFILKLPPFIGAVLGEVTGKLIRLIVLSVWLILNKDKDQINQQINQLAARNVCEENSITIINDIKITSFTCLNSYTLQFDRDWFIFECNRSSLFNLLPHPTTNIQKKDINNTENQEYCQRDKTLCINEITANSSCHQIYIKTIKEIYTINCLSKPECKWIIQEIKKWLYQSE